VVIIGFTWQLGTLVFRPYDPFLAFFHMGKGIDEMPWAYASLGVVILGSLWIERFFCKYACPLGAVIGILAKVGLTKIHRDETDCKSCNICHKNCHAHVDFLAVTTITDSECNHCMDCVVDCPKPNVLSLRGPRWRFSHPVYATMLVVGLLGLVGASQMAGKWQTKPAMVSFSDGKGKLEPENIRGWMNLQEISAGYGVPLAVIYRGTGLPERVPPTTAMNKIAKEYSLKFEPDKIRDVVRNHLAGKTIEAPAVPVAPKTASVAATPAAPAGKSGKSKQAENQHQPGEEPEVKGFMTLNEIALKTGVPKDYLLKTLGLPTTIDGRTPIRDWMHDHGKTVGDLREAVAAYRKAK